MNVVLILRKYLPIELCFIICKYATYECHTCKNKFIAKNTWNSQKFQFCSYICYQHF